MCLLLRDQRYTKICVFTAVTVMLTSREFVEGVFLFFFNKKFSQSFRKHYF